MAGDRLLAGARNFSVLHSVQAGYWAYPVSNSVGPEGKAAEA
jgi:hypothetical protein